MLYNGAKCLTSQLGRGTDYTNIRPVTVITVADCVLLPDCAGWKNRFSLREQTTGRAWPASGLELVFVELPKIDLSKLPVAEPLHDWLEFLKNASHWHTIPRDMTNPAVRDALRLARQDSLSPSEANTMRRRQLYREDQKNMLLYAQREGTALGSAQGLQKGREDAALDFARSSLRRGLSPNVVAEITGLSLLKIKKLQAAQSTAPRKPGKRAAVVRSKVRASS